MKIKCRPEDFFVEELAELHPGPRGALGLYVLEKRGLSTLEAIAELARRLNRPPSAISAGGLKDKYALTRQHVTIPGRPVPPMQMRGMKLEPLGRVEAPMTAAALRGNRFAIILRDLPDGTGRVLAERAELAARQGLPNYFDEQRFGSLRGGKGFIARRLLEGDFEGALRMHLGAPSKLDSSRIREQRRRIEGSWGRWDEIFRFLPRGNERSVVDFLRGHPGRFAQAFELIESRLAQLYLFAYQSYIWNEILGRFLELLPAGGPVFRLPYAAGELRFLDRAAPEQVAALREMIIPLPCPKARYEEGPLAESAAAVLSAEGLGLEQLRIRGTERLQFRGGQRPALVFPGNLRAAGEQPDDLYHGRRKLRLDFTMPPGSYATILIKFVARDLLPGSRASRNRLRRRR
ncbi:MAG TPA: tRNA pseudouridine(13) synthase TruD [Planctomycetota bacterium]|nr:tRNA pseudouridine(13) synthase TruD [Planctomycetota bacterium]